jgi:hypothetical protein
MNRCSGTALLVALLLCAGGTVVSAQVVVGRASTVGESHARGFADVVRAHGDYNLWNSEAAINYATARRQELENDLRQTEVFFQRRALNRRERFGDYPQRAARNAERAAAQADKKVHRNLIRYGQTDRPSRLTSRELDPITGQITWSLFLQGPEYAEQRKTIEAIMHRRALQDGILMLDDFQAATAAVDQMQSILQGNIRTKRSMDFINTRNFLTRLESEIRNPPEDF